MNETEQIFQARQGDETAWIALLRHHQVAIFRFVYLLLGDVSDDCCSMAMITERHRTAGTQRRLSRN